MSKVRRMEPDGAISSEAFIASGHSTRCMKARSLSRTMGGIPARHCAKAFDALSIISSWMKDARGGFSSGSDMRHPIQNGGNLNVADKVVAAKAGKPAKS